MPIYVFFPNLCFDKIKGLLKKTVVHVYDLVHFPLLARDGAELEEPQLDYVPLLVLVTVCMSDTWVM